MTAQQQTPSTIRDRIVELRRVPAGDLIPNPRNWRRHPEDQRDAMRGLLEEVGYAGALLARETPEGLQIIDGHLRSEVAPQAVVPVLVLDVSEAEADKILATYDPVSAMAEADGEKLDALLRTVDTGDDAIRDMLSDVAAKAGLLAPDAPDAPDALGTFCILVTCDDEQHQLELLDRMLGEGLQCRGLIS